MLSGGGGLEIQARERKRAWSGPKVVQHANGTSRLVSPNLPNAGQDTGIRCWHGRRIRIPWPDTMAIRNIPW